MYCRHCGKTEQTHVDGKCLFESTRYAPPLPGDSVEKLLQFTATYFMTPDDVRAEAINLIALVHPNGMRGAQGIVQREAHRFNLSLQKGDSVDIRLKWVIL